jgi:hypothetical protein
MIAYKIPSSYCPSTKGKESRTYTCPSKSIVVLKCPKTSVAIIIGFFSPCDFFTYSTKFYFTKFIQGLKLV